MALQVTVGGVDRTAQMSFESLEVTNTIAANADVARLELVVQPGAGWRPQAGNEVIVTNGTTREFAGMLMRVTERGGPAGTAHRYSCDCRDYLYLFNKKLIAAESSELAGSSAPTAGALVSAIVALSTDGFSSTGVATGTSVVATQKYDYVPPGDIVRGLASAVNYLWWIDYSKVVYFVSAPSMSAPVASIDLDSDVTNYGSMDITESVDQVKDRVYIKDWKQKSDVTYSQSFVGDGASKFFNWGYEFSAVGDVSASINGTPLTVRTDGIDASAGDGIGTSSGIYICFDNLGARMNYAPTSTETLIVAGSYMTPGFLAVEDTVAQSTAGLREGGDGIHEFAISDPGKTASDGSATLALAYGTAILNRDAYARISGRFTSFTQGWRAGQTLVVSSTKRMNGISKTVITQSVTKKLVNHPSGGSPKLSYLIEFADGALAQ